MKFRTLVTIGALLAATPAPAHDAKGVHGGRVADAVNFHVEMIAKDGAIEVYLLDHSNKTMPLAGYKGVAILSVDGKSQRIVLETTDGSRLSGKAAGALPAEPKGVVQITSPAGKTVQAKFN